VSENIHIVPAMGDDGSSEGACYLAMIEEGMIDELKEIKKNYNMPYFGSSYTKEEVREVLDKNRDKIKYKELGDDWYKVVAKMLVEGKIGALFRGRMEWGPRALGNRSIIARVNDPDIQKKMNKEIKRRPEFQPFCPSILIDEKDRLFEKTYNNKHMTIAFQMKDEHIKNIPSAVHIDGTARVQFVSKEDNEGYYNLIKEVKNLTSYGVIINTSFNKHGRTIVESPQDAITDFLDTDMDYLFIEGFLVERID
jgi:carbamoyltransferase